MKDNYLIKNSTKEEREKRVDGAIAISMLDSEAPTEKAMELYQKYIDGELELEQIQKLIIEKYKEV